MSERSTHCVISVLLIAILLCSLITAARSGMAASKSYFAGLAWSSLRSKSSVPEADDLVMIQNQYQQALTYDSDNPDLWRQLGSVYEAQVLYLPVGDSSAIAAREQAHACYLKALSLRPGWPHYWADLLFVKYRLHQLDEEFYSAMHNALTLGPWEFWVQHTVAEIGMHHWENMTDGLRAQILETIRNGVLHRDGAQTMLDLVKRYDMLSMVCTNPADDFLVKKYCEQERSRSD